VRFTCVVLHRKATEDRYYSPPPHPHPNPHPSTIAIATLSYPFTAHKCLQYITVACQRVDETIVVYVRIQVHRIYERETNASRKQQQKRPVGHEQVEPRPRHSRSESCLLFGHRGSSGSRNGPDVFVILNSTKRSIFEKSAFASPCGRSSMA
jgi:hypothetical protein